MGMRPMGDDSVLGGSPQALRECRNSRRNADGAFNSPAETAGGESGGNGGNRRCKPGDSFTAAEEFHYREKTGSQLEIRMGRKKRR